MSAPFVEMITFQVKPEKISEFEDYVKTLKEGQAGNGQAAARTDPDRQVRQILRLLGV